MFLTQPTGFENGDFRIVYRLNKALHGLKQSPRAWHKNLDEKMSALGFEAYKSDDGMYVRKKERRYSGTYWCMWMTFLSHGKT